jgi:predicted metal-binding protein
MYLGLGWGEVTEVELFCCKFCHRASQDLKKKGDTSLYLIGSVPERFGVR